MKEFMDKIKHQTSTIIAIDFDGVIHKNSKGYHDGTVYDEPVEGVHEALKKLSEKYTIIIYTCKASPDRPLINNKTGKEMIWEWLKKYNLEIYISEVTHLKPRAKLYIDDKAISFLNWNKALIDVQKLTGD